MSKRKKIDKHIIEINYRLLNMKVNVFRIHRIKTINNYSNNGG